MGLKKPCPLCGGEIPADAYYCRHCKQNLPTDGGGKVIADPVAAVTATREIAPGSWFCIQCEQFGKPRKVTKGSFAIEVVMWLALVFPGIIYSLWRLASRYQGCRFCGSTQIVPMSSPKAQAARAARSQ